MKKHKIISVAPGSIAWEMELEAGDYLLSINGQEVKDMLDYRWFTAEEYLALETEKPGGEVWEIDIEKDGGEDLGITFAPGSMGEDRRCKNTCIFCFIDQQPPGLRGSLYVKDDDFYQSFAVGNYITLTNLSDDDIAQIIKYRLSPMRVSVHAGDMGIRQQMMGSVRAGKLMEVLKKLTDAGIYMHFQAVLCKGINDGPMLDYTIERLLAFGERALSLAIVPVGLTRYREGLYPLTAFSRQDAGVVIDQVEKWQARCIEKIGRCFVFLADEWYVLAGRELPGYDSYEDFPQLDNGVGMMTLFYEDFSRALAEAASSRPRMSPQSASTGLPPLQKGFRIGIATGKAAGAFMERLSRLYTQSFPDTTVDIHVITNDFYGPDVTVSGLLTGQDIIRQLKGRLSGQDVLFIPENAFRSQTEDMLDGVTLTDISQALGVKAIKGSQNGEDFCRQLRYYTTS